MRSYLEGSVTPVQKEDVNLNQVASAAPGAIARTKYYNNNKSHLNNKLVSDKIFSNKSQTLSAKPTTTTLVQKLASHNNDIG